MKAQNVAYLKPEKKSTRPAAEEQTMKVICFASKKGGVSKTTSAVITGLILAEDKKVLLIDLDSQNALTSFFFDDITKIQGKTILEAIKGEKLFSQVIFEITPNLHVIPSVLQFEEIDEWGRTGKELILKKELKRFEGMYDYVILDTPPNLRSETVFGLVAADIIVIPARLEKMDTRAIDFTIDKINRQIREDFNPTLEKIYILPTQYNYQNRTVNDLALETLKSDYKKLLLGVCIPYTSKISQFNYLGFQDSNSLNNFPEYREFVEVIK
jgi:cellulose biosynthesis protein BcsQ